MESLRKFEIWSGTSQKWKLSESWNLKWKLSEMETIRKKCICSRTNIILKWNCQLSEMNTWIRSQHKHFFVLKLCPFQTHPFRDLSFTACVFSSISFSGSQLYSLCFSSISFSSMLFFRKVYNRGLGHGLAMLSLICSQNAPKNKEKT
jgi:hypothetical protein